MLQIMIYATKKINSNVMERKERKRKRRGGYRRWGGGRVGQELRPEC